MRPDDAVAERIYAAERDVALVRVAVIALNTFVYFLLLDPALKIPELALPLMALAWTYSVLVLVLRPYRRFPILLSSYATVVADATLINLWLYATGGFHSPFVALFYVSIAAVSYRWHGRDTMIAATLYSASYVVLLAANGDLNGHGTEITLRVGYVFLLAVLGVLLSSEMTDQIRAKVALRKAAEALEESEDRFRRLSEITLEGVTIHDEGKMLDVNHALAAMFGYKDSEMIGRSIVEFVAPECREEVLANALSGAAGAHQYQGLRADGSTFPIEVLARRYQLEGRAVRVATIRDITERVAAERALRESEAHFRALIENASDFIIALDRETIIRYVSPSVLRMMDLSEEEIVGTSGFSWVHPDDLGELVTTFEHRVIERGVGVPIEFRVHRRDGSWRILEAIGNFNLLDEPSVRAVILNARDITDRRLAEDAVKQLAYHDALTGLPNRAFFEEQLRGEIERARRAGEVLAVLFIDVDNFKLVNDTLGHAGGDELLQVVSEELRELIRGEDTVARVGGDEFVLLLTGLTHTLDAVATAQRVLARLDRRRVIRGHELRVTTSIGISIYPRHGEDADSLMANADIAMYEAKDRGRNGYREYSSLMKQGVAERLALENDFRNALDRGELLLHYQPIYDSATETMVAAEGLVRWKHPSRGLIYPDQFVPFAAESALIVAMDEWVLGAACTQASAWRRAGHPVQITVNLSPRSLQRDDLVELTSGILEQTGLPAEALVLEITEGSVLSDAEAIVRALRQLRELGVSISVDDFGTGYSSLSYLKRLPLDSVKIDRSFVSEVTVDRSDSAIVATIISMAHNLNLKVVAEGVESREQLAFLRASHCDEVQGYFFSRPVPAEALHDLLDGQRAKRLTVSDKTAAAPAKIPVR